MTAPLSPNGGTAANDPAAALPPRYQVFISYSHAADGKLAPELQKGLQRFAKPWNRRRALTVFRDQSDLGLNPGLWTSIEEALGQSEFFLLLASPRAAASDWIAKEVRFWKASGRRAKLLIVLTDGEIMWDERTREFDWTTTTALPRVIEGTFDEEPLFLDMRWARTEDQLGLDHTGFREAIASIAAAVRGVPKADLESEEVREARRTRRLARSAFAALAGLLLATAGAASVAVVQRQVALANARLSDAQRFATQSQSYLDRSQHHLSLVAALHSLQVTSEDGVFVHLGETQLYASLSGISAAASTDAGLIRLPVPAELGQPPLVLTAATDPERCRLAVGGTGGTVRLWRTCSYRAPQARSAQWIHGLPDPVVLPYQRADQGSVLALAFDPSGTFLAAGGTGGLALWRFTPDSIEPELALRWSVDAEITALAFSDDGAWLSMGSAGGQLAVLRIDAAELKPPVPAQGLSSAVTALAFSPDSRRLVVATLDGVGVLQSPQWHQDPEPLTGDPVGAYSTAYSRDGRWIASASLDGAIRVWDAQPGTPPRVVRAVEGPVVSVGLSVDGEWIAGGFSDGSVRLWSTAAPEAAPRVLPGHERLITSLHFSTLRSLVSTSYDGTVRSWAVAFEDLIDRTCRILPRVLSSLPHPDAQPDPLEAVGIDPDVMARTCFEPIVVEGHWLARAYPDRESMDEGLDAAVTALSFARRLDPDASLVPGVNRRDVNIRQLARELQETASAGDASARGRNRR